MIQLINQCMKQWIIAIKRITVSEVPSRLWFFMFFDKSPGPWKKTLMLVKIEGRRRRGDRGWDGWMASPTQWSWVWANSGRQGRTGKSGMLQSTGSQRVQQDSVGPWIPVGHNCVWEHMYVNVWLSRPLSHGSLEFNLSGSKGYHLLWLRLHPQCLDQCLEHSLCGMNEW